MSAVVLPEGYTVSADPGRLNLEVIHRFISESYWAKNIPKSVVETMIQNSIGFGVYHGEEQVGFARVVTDKATFAYLADVFILQGHRGKGLSKALMEAVLEHPCLLYTSPSRDVPAG